MSKKVKQIKAEEYKEETEEFQDDYYEEDFEQEYVAQTSPNTFKPIETESEDEEEYYEEAKKTFRRANYNKFMKIFNVFFVIIILILLIIAVDVISITKYNAGPFFAIKTNTYEDGGSKEYYGLGYKIIKYSEINGRQDTQIGFWNMKYSTEPITLQDLDLAIAFRNDPEKTADAYFKKYVLISSTIKEIDIDKNELLLEYTDPDGKYTLQIKCDMSSKKEELTNYSINDKIQIKGTVYKFKISENNKPNSVSILNCYIG